MTFTKPSAAPHVAAELFVKRDRITYWGRCVSGYMGILFVGLMGCRDVAQPLPPGTIDPGSVRNAAGAQGMYVATRVLFQQAVADYSVVSGVFTDELQSTYRGQLFFAREPLVLADARRDVTSEGLSSALGDVYRQLHAIRQNATQARGALATYDAAHSAGRRAILYAWQGYAEVMLAELFCSGVPLSTFEFGGDFTYGPSLSTDAVYQHAIAMMDSARIVAPDSVAAVWMARMGIARALLGLGDYARAADSIHSIPTEWAVAESIKACAFVNLDTSCAGNAGANPRQALSLVGTVANRDGGTGYPFLTPFDPRTATSIQTRSVDGSAGPVSLNVAVPEKYPPGTVSPFIIVSGIEARLIDAEADLRGGGTVWLSILNALRTNGTFTTTVQRNTAGDSIGVDTVWNAGTGGVAGLRPLEDPETDTARLSVVFGERAPWLFLTGRRQGDLRRLVRRDHRAKSAVYPTGAYPLVGAYGDFIELRIPDSERQNPQFHGCLNRD